MHGFLTCSSPKGLSSSPGRRLLKVGNLRFAAVFSVCLALATAACGGGGGGASDEPDVTGTADVISVTKEPIPILTKQERYSEADFLSKVEADPALQALWNKLQQEGYSKLSHAGIVEQEDGVTAIWAEAFGLSLPTKGILRHCNGDDCLAALWKRQGNDMAWEDADGAGVEPRTIGLPVLLKALEGHSFDNPTHAMQALDVPAELPDIDVSARRFYLLSSFGPLWADGALDTSGLEKLAKDSGAFDLVQKTNYVRGADIDSILLHSHPFDVFVWLGQGVREEAKTNQVWKPVGMTVNRGVFGDELYDRNSLEDNLETNPLKGPGLMVLAGCETMGDGNGGGEWDKSLPVTLDNKARILVGFKKCGDGRYVLAATTLFFQKYFGGSTLGDSLTAANEYLAGEESQLEMVTLPETDLEQTFLVDVGKFWDDYTDDGEPGDSFFNTNILVINMCEDETGKQYQEDEFFATAWSNEISWSGPFFSGSRSNPENKVDFTVEGSLIRIREGAQFFFAVKGNLKPEVQGVTLYGTGLIEKIKVEEEKLDEFIIQFKGQGYASAYVNAAGHQCVMQPPFLVTTTGELSSFKIPVTLKTDQQE